MAVFLPYIYGVCVCVCVCVYIYIYIYIYVLEYILQYSCLENPHGQRSLVEYSPWGQKESDMTEQLSTAHEKTTSDP